MRSKGSERRHLLLSAVLRDKQKEGARYVSKRQLRQDVSAEKTRGPARVARNQQVLLKGVLLRRAIWRCKTAQQVLAARYFHG